MPVISKTRIDQVIYRLSQDQVAVHTRLKSIHPQVGAFLLKPREEGGFMYWDLDSNQIQVNKITVYSHLNENEKSKVHDELNIIKGLIANSGDDRKILDIPSLDSIKLLETNVGQRVVVDSWGHLPFDSSKGVNIITFTPKPGIKSVNVELFFHYFDKSLASGYDVIVYNNGFPTPHKTNTNGIVSLGSQLVGKDFQIEVKDMLQETIVVKNDNNVFEFQIPYLTEVNVKVVDQETNESIADYWVSLSNNGNRADGKTDKSGLVAFKNIEAGNNIEVTDNKIFLTHYVTKGQNFIELKVKNIKPEPQQPSVSIKAATSQQAPIVEHPNDVFFTVYGLDGKEISDYYLEIQQDTSLIPTVTDIENTNRKKVSTDNLNMNSKSIGIIKIDNDGKNIIHRCKFKTDPDRFEYFFQIKKAKNWWWLLWLIPLFLSLLITFGKDIKILIKDNQNLGIPNAGVNMRYQYMSLFNFGTLKFMTIDSIEVDGVTDSLGLVTFENNPTTVFDFVFKLRRDAKINIMVDTTCYNPTAALIKFYKVFTTHEIIVQNKTTNLEVYVLETNSGSPIADAKVDLTIEGEIIQYTTDQEGKIVVPNVNTCSYIKNAYAFKDYPDIGVLYSDTLKNMSVKKGNLITLYINEPQPCRDTLREGGVEGDRILLATPNLENEYYLIYDFMNIPDQLLIYSYPDGKLIHNTGFRSSIGEFRFKPKDVCNGCKIIYMEVQTNDNNTSWRYYFKCHNNK